MKDSRVSVNIIQTNDVTAVELDIDGIGYVGAAKRHPKDAVNNGLGRRLALSRALGAAALALGAYANLQIDNAAYYPNIIAY